MKYKTDFPVIINLPQRLTATICAKLRYHVFSVVSHNIRIAGAKGHVRSFAMNSYPGDVVSKDVLKSFHNLLQGGDGTSTKKLDEDLDILWASKGGNADLSKWSKDDFSTSLIPDYIDCKYFAGKPVVTVVCVLLQRKNFIDTFWQPHFSIWRLKKNFIRQSAPAEKS